MIESDGSIQGFKCLNIKFDEKCTAGHTFFFKEHSVRNSHISKPIDRTLFVLNVPPYCTKEAISQIFKTAGDIATVFFQDKPSAGEHESPKSKFFSPKLVEGFKVAYVVFKDKKSLKKVMKTEWPESTLLCSQGNTLKTGISKWINDYEEKLVDSKSVQTEIDNFMKQFDRSKKNEDKELKSKEGVADEDGWVTVTRNSRNAGVVRTENMEQKVMEKEKTKQKNKKLLHFYSFQMRESKIEHLTQLRQKFEEDKRRIESMKAARRFKPY